MTTPTTTAYLAPILEAAKLLQLRIPTHTVDALGAILDMLSRGFPRDVMPPLEALRALQDGVPATVAELELLETVWPDRSGTVRYQLTATTLTRTWASKHSGRYATITVPFPTLLPLRVTVARFCDMDDAANHADECDEDGDCHCEAFVEQTVEATVTEWNDQTAAQLHDWLTRAVVKPVEPATFDAQAAV